MITQEGRKLGERGWQAVVGLSDESDPRAREVAREFFPDAGAARRFVNRKLAGQPPCGEGEYWWGEIVPGVWEDESFDDALDGHVTHAGWESDYDQAVTCYRSEDDKRILWAEP